VLYSSYTPPIIITPDEGAKVRVVAEVVAVLP